MHSNCKQERELIMQKIKFTKMQAYGNDYVYIDGGRFVIPSEEKPELVRHLSNRNFGIGSDGGYVWRIRRRTHL